MSAVSAVLGAVVVGLCASALHAARYRRRARFLAAICDVLKALPEGGTAWDVAEALGLSAFRYGTLYADLDLLKRRGRVASRWDAEAGRMFWFVRGGV